jgi:hypothetical protein
MRITGKRILNLDRYLKDFKKGDKVAVALRDTKTHAAKLTKAGFSAKLEAGETVLPSAAFGSVSEYNAEGKEVPDKTKPMETAYRTVWWTWQEFRGRYDSEEKSDYRDVSYKRYPRKHYPPPGVELQVANDPDGNKLVIAGPFDSAAEAETLLHSINLFLELFGECELVPETLKSVIRAKVVRLNWHLLPPGKHPWKTLAAALEPVIKANAEGNQQFVTDRLNKINGYDPEFVALGRGGFHGYVVFGFPKKNLFVLESALYGNATYVFEQDWQKLSQLTKAEILEGNLHKQRIVHLRNWFDKIYALLK